MNFLYFWKDINKNIILIEYALYGENIFFIYLNFCISKLQIVSVQEVLKFSIHMRLEKNS